MKKLIIVVVVLAALLLVAPFGVGKLAEKRLDHGLDKLVQEAPYLTIVERKYTGGWFKSEQVVTFEVFSAWMKALEPKAMEEAMEGDASADGDAGDVDDAQGDAQGDAAGTAAPAADAAEGDAAPPAEEAPKLNEMMRFTVRNEVLHGPVLGLSGLGVARVESHFVMTEEIRKKVEEIFGPKTPLEISTRIGFLGGGTTTFKSEGRTIKPKDSDVAITYDTLKLAVGFSKDADKYDLDGKWPKLEVVNSTDKSHFVMTDMTLDGDGKRVIGDLYDGDFTFGIEKFGFTDQEGSKFEMNALHYVVNTDTKSDFTSVSARFGTGEVTSKELAAMGVNLKEIHYDIGVRHLHAPTLEKILAGFKTVYSKPIDNALEANDVILAPLKENGMELLKYDPEFVIERVGIVTPDGDGAIKGTVKLVGATPEDFGGGSMGLIPKIDADITVDVSEKMIQKFPNGSTMAGAAVDSGYVKREKDRLICKIVFAKGALTVNGKPQAIPGLGGPPPGGMEGGMEEAPPPQE
jgi:uncharacterized protein YdgA (DUF945 family)